ncbi:MAG: hypothetical protein HY260_12985, partial [Chloroflexi bacterium]|nr:hypothetical protein [Chloroflexota bacterium]
SNLITASLIAVVGMLLLFAAMAVLYGMMYLMTALIKDGGGTEANEPEGELDAQSLRHRAAVIAVALARAQAELSPIGWPEPEEAVRPWRQYHRNRALNMHGRARTAR